MRDDLSNYKRQRPRSKKRLHRDILTLDDLPRTNWKYSQLIAKLQARYEAEKEQSKDKPSQKPEDLPI